MPLDKEDNELGLTPSHNQIGEIRDAPYAHDAVFGDITEDGPNYRNVGWMGTIALMIKTQIGLGVLSIPGAFDILGIVPGVICLLAIAAITTWSDYMVGVFKLNHREVYGIDDAGGLMFGRLGREFFAFAFCLSVFLAVAAIIGFVFSSIQTLGRLTLLAWLGAFSILTSILILTISVGVQDRPAAAPQDAPWASDFKIIGNPSFSDAISAVATLVFGYAGTPGFFSIVSEMRDPGFYPRSLMICQSVVTGTYIIIGCVVYYYCGSYVASPALGSAGVTMKKVCYGVALPGLMVTIMLVSHLPAKYIFLRILRGSRHLTANTFIHWATWLSCTFSIAIIAYIIASAIPVFDGLVSLVGALLGTLMSFQPMGCMWLYDNWSKGKVDKKPRWIAMVCWSCFVVASGTFLMVAGTYGSVVSIMNSYKEEGGSAPWSCADNSNSV
ncbi:hypothetical protein AWENTII_009389 [Aspergillus wentii]|nr:hypothetical protein MW887_001106 [Aspergillus wentii]